MKLILADKKWIQRSCNYDPDALHGIPLLLMVSDPPGYYVVSYESNTAATLLQDLETDPHYAY